MPAAFKNYQSRAIGTTNTQVGSYTVPSSTNAMLLTLSLSNITNGAITANVYHNNGTNNTSVVSQAPIPVGGSLEINKIAMQTGHMIYVVSNTASAIDAVLSVMELQ